MLTFIAVATIMTLVAVVLIVMPLFRSTDRRAPFAGLVAALALPAAVMLLYASLSTYPWGLSPAAAPGTGGASTAPIVELERQVAEQPEQLSGWLTLAGEYMAAERFAEARDAYARAIAIEPGNSDARLGTAEAAIMLDRDALAGEAGRLIEEVLAAEPDNAKALWYSGIAALGRGANDVVKDRWGRLLALSPPDQVRQIIEGQLAQLETAGANPSAAATGAMRLEVRVRVAPEMADKVKPGAAVFLIARDPDRPGPPVAVVRGQAASLPSTMVLTDADVMVPGQSLANLAKVGITARIANGGEATATSGDVFGETVWARGVNTPLEINVDRIVP